MEHERNVTKKIHDVVDLARKYDDKALEVFLNWFVNEQVEEEKIFGEILQLLEFTGATPQALLVLDSRLAQRK